MPRITLFLTARRIAILLLAVASVVRATVILDDTWADGTRTDTDFPTESAWFASSADSLTATTGSLTASNSSTGSRQWITYFTPDGSAVELNVGETLKVALTFTPHNVAVFGGGTQRGLRIGLFSYADGGFRVAADGFSTSGGNGANVTGYVLNQNFYQSFSQSAPMEILKRINFSSTNLMGTTADFTSMGSGPSGQMNLPAFAGGGTYTLEFSVTRNESATQITTAFFGSGLAITNSLSDSSPVVRFDAFAIRSANATNSADAFTFSRLLVTVTSNPPPPTAWSSEFYNQWAATNFSDIPAQAGPSADPDADDEANLIEFAFGTDARAPGGLTGAVKAVSGSVSGSNGLFAVEILKRVPQRSGAQMDLYLSAGLTNWFRPWWQRAVTNSHPSDPTDSVRELFITRMAGTNRWFVRPAVRLIEAGPEAANYYVATNGSDNNPGTFSQPFLTLSNAVRLANPGDLIYVRGGTYFHNFRIRLNRNGSAAQPIRVRAYPGEQPAFDFSAQSFGSANRGIEITGSWWHLYGLEIFGAGDNGINISGHSNIVERCVTHHCRDTGIQISQPGSYNLVLNCDSYRNFDDGTLGENADGFAAKLAGLGPGNVFRGCRAWENSDDGWDLFAAPNPVVIEDCWTWRNGIDFWGLGTNFQGDGNGFKIGGDFISTSNYVARCVAFSNPGNGFDQNNNRAGQVLVHNSAWGNGFRNYSLNGVTTNGTVHILRNNLSLSGSVAVHASAIQTSNSWQIVSSPAASVTDVLSVDIALALAPRRDDGGLPETPFLRPVPGGRLVNRGANLGAPFFGNAPDLGAFETPEW